MRLHAPTLFMLAMLASEAIAPVRSMASDPGDPLQIVVSLQSQQMQVWRGAELIAEAPVSSGKPGHDTPTGIFSILHKRRYHESNIYSNAPMPFMQRLTWTGIALHEGKLPGRPASHGCVRLPEGFAEELFGMTAAGAHVVINGEMISPQAISHPMLPMPSKPVAPAAIAYDPVPSYGQRLIADSRPALTVTDVSSEVGKPGKPLRVLITRRDRRELVRDMQGMLQRLGHYEGMVDGLVGSATGAAVQAFQRLHNIVPNGVLTPQTQTALYKVMGISEPLTGRIYVRQGFEPVFDAPVSIKDVELPLGTHLFTANAFDKTAGQTQWNALTLANRLDAYSRAIYGIDKEADDGVSAQAALARISVPAEILERVSQMLTPGSSISISDTGLGGYTGWQTDFIVTTKVNPEEG
jgi:peptidoglycan hydrolase-like protein with peptidoglycan-binding domain